MSETAKTDSNTVTLDPIIIRDIENLMLTKQLADVETKLAQAMLSEARNKAQQAAVSESAIIAALEKKTGKKLVGKIELLDRDKGLCRLT
jgi:hypothetical protein